MAYISEQKVGKHIYLYECESYRNDKGKPRSKKKLVGKLDSSTGERRYKPEYIERMRQAGTPVAIPCTEKIFSLEDIRKSSVLECGAFHLLRNMSESSGLSKAIAEGLPQYWMEVFMLAVHLVINGEPFMHCAEWIENTETYSVGDMSSQRISEILAAIQPEARERFYQAWCKRRMEKEYLALDITSVSSYSELVEDVEWGYNRDGDKLPQVNICLLVGEKSGLPVYQTIYSGSLKDVSTLRTMLQRFDAITGGKPVLVVMDKGFYSKKNIDDMLSKEGRQKFMIAVPFSSGFAKEQIEGERKDIDTITNTIRIGGETLRAVSRERIWSNEHKLHVHIYFSPGKAHKRREDIFGHVSMLRDAAEVNPAKYAESHEHKKYLNISKSNDAEGGYTVSIREDVVEAALSTHGWLVIISNDVANAKEAILIYRTKDVVEKGFLRLKCSLDVGRLRVHSHERMHNKVFVGFISLILLSQINSVMTARNMYARMTMKQLLRTLAKHRVQTISEQRIVYPATKAQREIYEAFGVAIPV